MQKDTATETTVETITNIQNVLISIITPTFNRADLIEETIQSIKEQSHTNWELVIVDDHSTDNTQEILDNIVKADNRMNWFKRPDSYLKGANACRNYGIKQSRGEYVVFFDSDDIMHPDYLLNLIETLYHNRNYSVAACKGQKFKITNHETVYLEESQYHEISFPGDFLSRKAPFGTPEFILKRDVLDHVAHWDETLFKAQDYDFFGRVLLEYPCKFIDKTLYYNRIHDNNITSAFFTRKYSALIKSDFKSRKKIYKAAKLKGALSNDFLDFILDKQLENFFHLLKIKKFIDAGTIFLHIISIRSTPNKKSKIFGFFKQKLAKKLK